MSTWVRVAVGHFDEAVIEERKWANPATTRDLTADEVARLEDIRSPEGLTIMARRDDVFTPQPRRGRSPAAGPSPHPIPIPLPRSACPAARHPRNSAGSKS